MCKDCLRDDEWSWERSIQTLHYLDTFLQLGTGEPLDTYEITVPTCSYRMGVANMGIGLALIGER